MSVYSVMCVGNISTAYVSSVFAKVERMTVMFTIQHKFLNNIYGRETWCSHYGKFVSKGF